MRVIRSVNVARFQEVRVSLIKKLFVSAEKLAANQSNGRQSQGPATPEGRERIRSANTRHGYYSQAPGAQMQVLGEDPEEFERLFESLRTVWEPENEYQTSLVRRMARLTWRLERADRAHEAMLVSQMETLERNIAHELRDAAARHDREVTRLRTLMQALDGNRFHSTEQDLEGLERIYGKVPTGVGLEILRRVYRLQSPRSGNPANSADPGNPGNTANSAEFSDPEDSEGRPEGNTGGSARKQAGAPRQAGARKQAGNALTIATGAERDVLRAELRLLLREEIKRMDEDHEQRRAELEEITPAFRDSLLVPKQPQAALLVRLRDSDLRQLRFVTDLLMKLKGRGNKPAGDAEPPKSAEYPTI
jgi:hypothetical protein